MFIKVFAKFAGKHLYQVLFFAANLIKKDTQAQVFPVNFAKIFIKHLSLQNTSGGCFYIIENAEKKLPDIARFFHKQHFCKQLQVEKYQAKSKQHPETELTLKFISSLHVRYHSKIELITCNKKCVSVFKFNDKRKWKWKIDHTGQGHVHKYTNNTKNVSVWCCLYILSNTSATSDTQFMKKLSNTEAELKKDIAFKKSK